MNEDKSVRYHRVKRRLSVLSLAWSAALLVALLATGANRVIADAAARATSSAALSLALVLLVLAALHEPVSALIDFYAGHVVERRYALSRQTAAEWLADHLKALGVGLAFMLATGSFVYWTMRGWPDRWWLLAGAGLAVVIVLLANLAPVILLPIFFRIEPLEKASLRERLERLAERAGARVVGVYRWQLGEKTSKANAALTGMGPTRRILLADTMIDQYSEDEIEVVLAHELAHHVHRDIWRGIALEIVLVLAGFFAADRVIRWAGPAFGVRGLADPAGLPLLVAAAGAAWLLLMPALLAVSRRHERRADRFALDLTRNPAAFTTAMKRLGAQNLAEDQPSRLVQWLFYSHPPLPERIAAANRWRPVAEQRAPVAQ
jgi:STE24 endopeptidase